MGRRLNWSKVQECDKLSRGFVRVEPEGRKFSLEIAVAPVPPLSAYECWMENHPLASKARSPMTARKLHRYCRLVRSGETAASAARSIGFAPGGVKGWMEKLPPELLP